MMLLVIPDIRLLQNLAYGLLFVFVKLDWAVLNQAVIVLGGIFWEIWPRWVPSSPAGGSPSPFHPRCASQGV
jgi:hypothetical protein